MSRPPLRPRPPHGVTLVEALVCLALLAALGMLAAPGLRSQMATARLSSATHELTATLMQARMQALRLGRRVTVCPSTEQLTCNSGPRPDWRTGWILFQDSNGDQQRDPSEPLLLLATAQSPETRILGNGAMAQRIVFDPSGGARANGRLRVCSTSASLTDAHRARDLVVQQTGRVVVERIANLSSACPAP